MFRKSDFIGATLILGLLMLCTSCAIEPLVVRRMEDLKVKDMLTSPTVQFSLLVYNPNRAGVTLTELTSKVGLDGHYLADVHTTAPARIAARDEVRIPFSVKPTVQNLQGIMLSGKPPKKATGKGQMTVRKFIFRKTIPFDEQYKL